MVPTPTPSSLKPINRQDPIPWRDTSEVIFLAVQIRRDVMAEQGKEAGNCKSLVTVAEDFKVDSMAVEDVGEEGDCGVDRHHEEDSDDAAHMLSAAWKLELQKEGTYCFCSHGLR